MCVFLLYSHSGVFLSSRLPSSPRSHQPHRITQPELESHIPASLTGVVLLQHARETLRLLRPTDRRMDRTRERESERARDNHNGDVSQRWREEQQQRHGSEDSAVREARSVAAVAASPRQTQNLPKRIGAPSWLQSSRTVVVLVVSRSCNPLLVRWCACVIAQRSPARRGEQRSADRKIISHN